jgi:hypothetical protein
MGTAITLSVQHGGVDPCIDEDLAHCICTPLRQPHISGLRTNTIRVAANPNRRSGGQLFHQTGRLLQENLRVRRNLGAIGSAINGWEIKSRLIRANWVFDAETRRKRGRRGRRFVSAATW